MYQKASQARRFFIEAESGDSRSKAGLSEAQQLVSSQTFAADIARGMSSRQKYIPSKYLYDQVGTALFETITLLREYNCTRAEQRLLLSARNKIFELLSTAITIVELGAGNGAKASTLLSAFSGTQQIDFHNIDISESAIELCRQTLSPLTNIRCIGHVCDFKSGLQKAVSRRKKNKPMLVLFLGSSIGNYEPAEALDLLRQIRSCLIPGDFFLLGTDLVKPVEQLIEAYDDAAGVTAAFNKNILVRINHQLQANFDPRRFKHLAKWNSDASRIEMHLLSLRKQEIDLKGLSMKLELGRGESIHTESSHKYHPGEIAALGAKAGFSLSFQWLDEDALFASNLFAAV